MTGEELRLWRENHKLTQAQLAQLLNWTRDQIASRELGRVAIPEGYENVLALIAETLNEKPPAAAAQMPNLPTGAKRRYLSLDGMRVRPEHVRALKLNQCYWEYGWKNEETGFHHFWLMQMGRDAFGKIMGLCTPISLNVNMWKVEALVMEDNEAVQKTMPDLQARLDKNKAAGSLPELSTVLMSNDDAFRPISEIYPPNIFSQPS